jgi:hypothetical protein
MARRLAKAVGTWKLRVLGPFEDSSATRFGTEPRAPWRATRLVVGYLAVVILLTAVVVVTTPTNGV